VASRAAPLLILLSAILGADGLAAAQRGGERELRILEALSEEQRELLGLGAGGGLAALERDLTNLYLQLSPSVVEVTSRFVDASGSRDIVTAGVVLSPDGHVVAPVFRPASADGEMEVWVRRADGERFRGELLASEERYGLSVLQAPELRGMHPRLFPGEFLMEGAPVFSLGNAFGLDSSMSFGLLTGKRRYAGEAVRLLQVTNAINPGDGGGLLADVRGQVVGVLLSSLPDLARAGVPVGADEDASAVTLDAERALRSQGIAFAVPVEVVVGLFPAQLGGLMRRNRMLGVEVVRRLLILEGPEGPERLWALEVRSILPGSAAAAAGIRTGDQFVELGGAPIGTLEDLGFAIFSAPEETLVVLRRGGVRVALPVDFSIRPQRAPPAVAPDTDDGD
jgi:S1-C subfamily serine protease